MIFVTTRQVEGPSQPILEVWETKRGRLRFECLHFELSSILVAEDAGFIPVCIAIVWGRPQGY